MGKCVYLYSVLRDCPKDFPLPGPNAFPAEPGDGKPFKKEEACRRKQFLLHAFVYLCGCATCNPRKRAGGGFPPALPAFLHLSWRGILCNGLRHEQSAQASRGSFRPLCPRFSICHGGKYCAMGCATSNPRKQAEESFRPHCPRFSTCYGEE